MIRVVAVALKARPGNPESCNCGLSSAADTDNHIVLVDPNIKEPNAGKEREEGFPDSRIYSAGTTDAAKVGRSGPASVNCCSGRKTYWCA